MLAVGREMQGFETICPIGKISMRKPTSAICAQVSTNTGLPKAATLVTSAKWYFVRRGVINITTHLALAAKVRSGEAAPQRLTSLVMVGNGPFATRFGLDLVGTLRLLRGPQRALPRH